MSSRNAQLFLANLALVTVLILGSAMVFDGLPDRIPRHFDGSGLPDGFADKSWIAWMLMPVIALFVTLLMAGAGWLIRSKPEWMNAGNQKKYQALSTPAKRQVAELGEFLVLIIALGMNLLFMAIQAGSYDVAIGESTKLPAYVLVIILTFTVGSLGVGIYAVTKSSSLIDRLYEAEHSDP